MFYALMLQGLCTYLQECIGACIVYWARVLYELMLRGLSTHGQERIGACKGCKAWFMRKYTLRSACLLCKSVSGHAGSNVLQSSAFQMTRETTPLNQASSEKHASEHALAWYVTSVTHL